MKPRVFHYTMALFLAVLAGGLLGPAADVQAATDPVTVTVEATGTPGFDAQVTAKATVVVNDGSTFQSIAWTQVKGAQVILFDANTDTVGITLPSRAAYREYLMHVLGEPPISEEQLPPNIELGEEFVGGLQNRFGVVGSSPFALEHGSATVLEITVVTTSGTYHTEYELVTPLPWTPTIGIRNVPVFVPVLLNGKDQDTYNWALAKPAGSAAALRDATTQFPEFTPDVPGTYTVTVTDLAANAPVTMAIKAGLWKGIITGQDGNGRPTVDTTCTQCHTAVPALDKFTPWAQTGHAEIFTNNVNVAGHYTESCMSCHTVGLDKAAANNGIDDQSDYAAMMASGLVEHGAAGNWTQILAQFPNAARLANIQCESCHGPQDSAAHYDGDNSRITLSADMCGICHGEPARHGRFQQWQLSRHANYELAGEEGMSGGCAKCHTGNGFLAWGQAGFAANNNPTVTWTEDEIHPQTCATCHDPHAIGTTSGGPATNATVRISGDTPMLMAGFQATNVGTGAICMTCHNSRRGLRNDSNFSVSDASRAPHLGTQADMIMGQNLYFVETGIRSYHSNIVDTCTTCHMEATPPPPDLSYNKGGTNHTFAAQDTICSKCHTTITVETVQGPVEEKLHELKAAVEQGIYNLMADQIALGKVITIGTLATITDIDEIDTIQFAESHGRQGIIVALTDGTVLEATSMADVKAKPPVGAAVDLYRLGNPALPKAGWNLAAIETDGSLGVHNPTLIKQALDVSLYAVKSIPSGSGFVNPAENGGPGSGVGAVSCTTPYVYWAEIAAHLPGANASQWRTDMVAKNISTTAATVKFYLHTSGETYEYPGTVPAAGQNSFEDIVAKMGQSNAKGALEICSSQPLLVAGRMFNQAPSGTFGQFIDGHVANLGLATGDTGTLLGLRQQVGAFRTNISVTNGGTDPATVEITLFKADGTQLLAYELEIEPGQVVQDLEPFDQRAHEGNVGWGFATVEVIDGLNVRSSASVIDEVTNDPVTIPAKM